MRIACNNKPYLPSRAGSNTVMTDPNVLDMFRLPSALLIALDWRPLHFALQPFHHLIRLTHILAMSGFYGGIGLLDLRLLGWNPTIPLQPLIHRGRPLLYGLFATAIVTGVALFLYEPVKVGSHAYFVPKLALIALGMTNAGLFHGRDYRAARDAEAMARHARLAGAVSLALWTAVIVCACLNSEAAPKLLLR